MPIEMNGDIGTSPLCGQPLVNANFAPADFEPIGMTGRAEVRPELDIMCRAARCNGRWYRSKGDYDTFQSCGSLK
jgi:hypothetical protein